MKSKQGPRQKTTFVTVSLASLSCLSLPQDVYVLSAVHVLFPRSRRNARPAMLTNGIRFPRKRTRSINRL